ncbi:lysM and putative peptidoglycan-binding domain-containing protein 2 [Pungitius pungitius]|uniref:lysM and putative peptidoglycan-binding domain-containing protein 2 n=1 Tax=Pungitius pungitius TaxID=134920 RepID=UPI002E0EC9DC
MGISPPPEPATYPRQRATSSFKPSRGFRPLLSHVIQQKMADFSPVLSMRDGGGRFGQPIFPRSRSGSESESELSQSLARTKIRSYGSTASVTASLGEKYIEHRVTDSDTLQGIALKYGVTMEQIKRANKLFSNDCIFLKNSLSIPVASERRYIFNGLSLESPDGDGEAACQGAFPPCVALRDIEGPSPAPSPPPQDSKPPQPEELSAKDFLHRLDLQIKQSKQAARRLKDEEVRNDEDYTAPTTSYQEI